MNESWICSGVKIGRNVCRCNKYIKPIRTSAGLLPLATGVSACATREPSMTLITSGGIPRV